MIRRYAVEASVLLAVVALALVAITSVAYTERVDASRRAEQIAGCERANVQRRYINEIVHRLKLGMPTIPIPVCADVIK